MCLFKCASNSALLEPFEAQGKHMLMMCFSEQSRSTFGVCFKYILKHTQMCFFKCASNSALLEPFEAQGKHIYAHDVLF